MPPHLKPIHASYPLWRLIRRRNEFESGGHASAPLHFFGPTSTIGCFGERFRGGQYSLVSFLFAVLLLTVHSRGQPFVLVGAHDPRALWTRLWTWRHCLTANPYFRCLPALKDNVGMHTLR